MLYEQLQKDVFALELNVMHHEFFNVRPEPSMYAEVIRLQLAEIENYPAGMTWENCPEQARITKARTRMSKLYNQLPRS